VIKRNIVKNLWSYDDETISFHDDAQPGERRQSSYHALMELWAKRWSPSSRGRAGFFRRAGV